MSRVSVIIPARNRSELLKRAVDSVLDQTFPDLELIVVDDGSTDDLSTIESLITGKGHKFYSTPPLGVSHARNFGVSVSSGDWISFLDTDDWWDERKLEEQFTYIDDNPALKIMQCEEVWYRGGSRVNPRIKHEMPSGHFFERAVEICCVSPSSVLLTKRLFLDYGGFDECMRVCEDYDLWLRISTENPIGLLEKKLVYKEGGREDQLSRQEEAMDRFRVYSVLKLIRDFQNLAPEYFNLAVRSTLSRLRILYSGAEKRGSSKAKSYKMFLDEIENLSNEGEDLRALCGELVPIALSLLSHPDGEDQFRAAQ